VSRFEWPGTDLAELGQRVRKQLRASMRTTRRVLPASAIVARSARIIEQLEAIEAFRAARSIGLFWPLEAHGEVDLRRLDAALEERGVARYYPFMDRSERGFVTGFRRIQRSQELEPRGHKFAEPPPGAPQAARGDLDLVLVPCLAATPEGHRLGYGKGFYDVTLPDVCPPALSVIVAFSFQLLGELPQEPHDWTSDAVVTDAAIYDPRGVLDARRSTAGAPGASPPRGTPG
jgi:5-formyltetrahydrofolate cyclo-ligase